MLFRLIAFAVMALFVTQPVAAQIYGDLDASFNKTGKLSTAPVNGPTYGSVAMALPDNRIVEAGVCNVYPSGLGPFYRIAVVRHLPNGALDSAFGENGTSIVDSLSFSGFDVAMALRPDGKTLVVTYAGSAMLDSNGALDPAYGLNGIVRNGPVYYSSTHIGFDILPNGHFVTAQHFSAGTGFFYIQFRKYKANGSADSTFGRFGRDTILVGNSGNSYVGSIKLQPDAKILCVGSDRAGSTGWTSPLLLMRLKANGGLDSSFASNGVIRDVSYQYGRFDLEGASLELQADGKILVGGSSVVNGQTAFTALRFKTNGAPDSSYGQHGACRIFPKPNFNSVTKFRDMVLQPDGKLLVCGNTDTSVYGFYSLARITAAGIPDSGFGTNSYVLDTFRHNYLSSFTPNPGTTIGDRAQHVRVRPDGTILITASANIGAYGFQLCAYDTAGKLINSFGTAGKQVTRAGRNNEYLSYGCIALPNGKVLVATSNAVITQRNADGSIDSSFGGDGIVQEELVVRRGGSYLFLQTAGFARSPSGRIYVALTGYSDSIIVARLNANGSIDTTYGKGGFAQHRFYRGKSICLQRDGRLLLYGFDEQIHYDSVIIMRLRTNGNIDQNFGTNGRIRYSFIGFNTPNAYNGHILELRNNKLLVCTQADFINYSVHYIGFARFHPDGSPDLSFGPRGLKVTSPMRNAHFSFYDDSYYLPVVQEDSLRRLVLSFRTSYGQQYIFRLDSTLKRDSTFGGMSYAVCPLQLINNAIYAGFRPASLLVQPDNKVLLGHLNMNPVFSNPFLTDSSRFAILRYKENGTPDSSFGINGRVITSMSPSGSLIESMALSYDGKLLAAGWAQMGWNKGIAVARYHLGIPAIDTPLSHGDTLDYPRNATGLPAYPLASKPVFYPNPLQQSGTLSYSLSGTTAVHIRILDLTGRQVAELAMGEQPAGPYRQQIRFPEGSAAGSYFVILETYEGRSAVKVIKE